MCEVQRWLRMQEASGPSASGALGLNPKNYLPKKASQNISYLEAWALLWNREARGESRERRRAAAENAMK
jgi:hypothetical protein